MATNTSRLGLLKKDTATDGNDTFNIKTMLNDNWDKIDAKVAVLGPDGKVPADQVNIPALADASTTQKGVVQLEDGVASTSITKAATPNSVKTVNDDLASHKAETTHVHWIGTATGTNTLTASYTPITEYKEGLGVSFKNTTASTGVTTLNINGLGAIPILKANGGAVTNLKANGVYTLRYSGGNFTLQGEGGEYGTATASDVLSGKTFGTENGLVNGTYIPNSIKSVQRGVIATSYGTKEYSATISAVDTTKSIVLIQRPNGNYLYDKPSPSFTNNTTVKFTFDSVNNSGGNLYYTIIEFTNVKSMQSGTIVVTGGALATASFTSVTMSKALLIAYFYNSDNSNGDAFGYCYSVLKTSTSADFYAKYTAWVKWVLIEFT